MTASTHRSFLVANAGMLALALGLEAALAGGQQISFSTLHQHLTIPTSHGFAILSAALGLWPVIRPIWQRRTEGLFGIGRWLTLAGCATLIYLGFTLPAALTSLVASTAYWLHLRTERNQSQPAR